MRKVLQHEIKIFKAEKTRERSEMEINKRKIDMNAYARRNHFNYFRSMANPYVGMTVNVDITDFLRKIREGKQPFFLSVLYHMANAANAIPEMRQRIVDDGIVEYDRCLTSHTVSLDDGTYCYCQLDCSRPFGDFIQYAQRAQELARQESGLDDGDEPDSLFFVSTIPWVSYANIIQPTPSPADSNPRITWGKYFEQEGKILMPVTLLCNHALVDGRHLAQFYENLAKELER